MSNGNVLLRSPSEQAKAAKTAATELLQQAKAAKTAAAELLQQTKAAKAAAAELLQQTKTAKTAAAELLQEAVDDLFFRFSLCETQGHQLDDLLACNLADGSLMNQGCLGAVGLQ